MPTTLAPTSKSRAAKQRAVALELYLQRLRGPSPGQASSVILDLRSDPWICSQIEKGLPGATGEPAVVPELVAHGCAFLAKSQVDKELLQTTGELNRHTLYTLQAELMLDAAIGKALLRELQSAVEDAVKAGDLAGAREFTQFGHRLRKEVYSAQMVIGEAERGDSDRLVDVMTEQPREVAPVPGTLDHVAREIGDAHEGGKRRDRVRRQVLSQVRLPSRTELLVMTLACSLLLWVGIAKLPQILDRGPRLIQGEDFPDTSIREVVARPPSLFVTLDASTWDAANATTRDSILAGVVSVPLVDDDYRGALVKTTDGRPVAAWVRGTGTRLFEAVEPLADPGDVEKAVVFVP